MAVRDVLQDFIQNVSPESQQRWDLALSMLFTWMKLHTEQGILQSGLEEALSNLKFTSKWVVFSLDLSPLAHSRRPRSRKR